MLTRKQVGWSAAGITIALVLGLTVPICGPVTCGHGGWLYDFQTLISGVLAIAAAAIAAWVVWRSAMLPIEQQRQRERETNAMRRDYLIAMLTNEFFTISERARQAVGTVKAVKAANKDVTEATKDKMYLRMPQVTQEWDSMALLGPEVIKSCSDLYRLVERHNFDVRRAGGAFGDDNFGDQLKNRAQEISEAAQRLAGHTLHNLNAKGAGTLQDEKKP